MNEIFYTSYQGQDIRFFLDDYDTFWFAAMDIEYILGYAYGATSCFRRLYKGFISHRTIGRHSIRFINERGICIALQSQAMNRKKKSNAIAFRKAFLDEIMPNLRKAYLHDEHNGHDAQLKLFEAERPQHDNSHHAFMMRHVDIAVSLDAFEKLSAFAELTGQNVSLVIARLAQAFVLKHNERIQQALENKKALEAISHDYMKGEDNFDR